MLSILIFLLSMFSSMVHAQSSLQNFQKLYLPTNSVGPESLTFDSHGRGPYTGISDGRIVRYDKLTVRFVDFAITSPNKSKEICDGTNSPTLRPTCGRPLGLEFYQLTDQLFIADAYLGLLVVGPNGNLATQLATSAEGIRFTFLNGLTVDQLTGDVYFTDFSSRFSQSQIEQAIAANDATGRLLKYNYRTQQVTVLQRRLSGANGVAMSVDRSYILVAEYIANRTRRFRLSGPRAFTSEVVVNFQGRPDNIRRDPFGNFLVALSVTRPGTQNINVPTAIRISGSGNVLQILPLDRYYGMSTISEILQIGAKYFVGSLEENYVGVFY